MKQDFRKYSALAHKNKTICVMGGADTLKDDMGKVSQADIVISVNGHGYDLRKPDYFLAMDEINSREKVNMGDYLRGLDPEIPIISPHGYADIVLGDWPQAPRFVLSGMIGIWVAYVMGAKCVIVCGMDANNGDPGMVDEARKISRDVETSVRVVSGPLTKIWSPYEPKEKFGKYTVPNALASWIESRDTDEIMVEVLKDTEIGQISRKRGDQFTISRAMAARFLRHRMIKEV